MKGICYILFGIATFLFLPCVMVGQNVGEWQEPCDSSVAGKSLRQGGVFDKTFRQNFKILKNSEETYVFNKGQEGENNFKTNGEKLFVNYSINEKQKKEEGQSIYSNLNHETTHAVQFEYGELGFEKIGNEWSAINYDIMDEYEAHYNQNKTFGWNVSGSPSELWINASQEQKIESLQKTYTDLPINSTNNDNKQRIKNGIMYAKPYQPRSHIGKMYYTPNLTCIDYIPINVRNLSTRRNDTIFSYNIYYFSGNVDSIVFRGIDVRICKNKWIGYNNDGDYTISSWKKTKPSKTYLQYNDSIFKAECEVISIRWDQYSSTGILKTSKRTFLGIKWYKTY